MVKLLVLLFSAHALFAEGIASVYLDRLSHAQTVHEMESLQDEYERKRISQTACEIQLREHFVPTACYEIAHFKIPVEKLDRLCKEAARNLRVQKKTASSHLSVECAKDLAAAERIQSYRAEEVESWSEN